jgi:hypothetical protein
MSKKSTFIIQYKYENEPWIEFERTQVPAMSDHYKFLAQKENPSATVRKLTVS